MDKREALIECLRGKKIRNPRLFNEIEWDGDSFCVKGNYVNVSHLPEDNWEVVKEPRKEVVEVFVPKRWKPKKDACNLATFLFGEIGEWRNEYSDVANQKVRVTIEEIE